MMSSFFIAEFRHYRRIRLQYRFNMNRAVVHCRLRPSTPVTMDSSSPGARRRLGHDATNTTQQGR